MAVEVKEAVVVVVVVVLVHKFNQTYIHFFPFPYNMFPVLNTTVT